MAVVKLKQRLNKPACGCGRKVAEGSVFCIICRAEVKRRNIKILNKDRFYVAKKN